MCIYIYMYIHTHTDVCMYLCLYVLHMLYKCTYCALFMNVCVCKFICTHTCSRTDAKRFRCSAPGKDVGFLSHSKLGVYIEDLENTALNLGSIAT